MIASSIVSRVYRLLGDPSQADLPYQDVLNLVEDVVRGRFIDMKMQARNHTAVIGSWVLPTDREMNAASFTGGNSHIIPVRMEWRGVGADDTVIPRRCEIVSLEMLNDLYRQSGVEAYAAFYNGFTSVAFSDHYDVVTNREYRLTYEDTDAVDITISGEVDMPEGMITLFQYETALLALDQVANQSEVWMEKRERLRGTLAAQVVVWDARFKKWQTSRFGNKVVTKLGFRPNRSR